MEPSSSSNITFAIWVTIYIMTMYYLWRVAQRTPRHPLSPRPRVHGHCCRYDATGKSRSSAVLGVPRDKTSLKVKFESSPFRAQQRWAVRPVNHPSLPPIVPASYPAAIPPFIPSQQSVHRCCAWIFPSLHPSTSSRCFTSKAVEAMSLIKVVTDAQATESLAFPTLNSFHAHCQDQGRRQDPRLLPRRNFPPGRAIRIDRPEGQRFTVGVNTFKPSGIRGGAFEPGPLIFMTGQATQACQSASTFDRQVSNALPPPVRRSIFVSIWLPTPTNR